MSDQVVNVASHLPAMALRQPDMPAVHVPCGTRYLTWTYRQLNDESDTLARGLEQVGIRRGVRTVLMVPPGLDFFALTFALFKAGAVPVLVDPGMGVKNLGRCLAEAEPAAFIGVGKAHLARLLLGWARKSVRTLVTAGRRWLWGGYSLQQIRQLGQSALPYVMAKTKTEETAAILFTSGSTGPAKGAVYTHGIFAAQVELLRQTFSIEPGEIDLCTFPLFALFAPALGMTAVVPDMDATRPGQVTPRNIIEPIQRFGVTNLFGSPALLRRIAGQVSSLPSLKRIISAGAPVGADVIEQVSQMLQPGVQVFTPYGATEALPVACIGSNEILRDTRQRTAAGAGVCVGWPVADVKVAIIRISDEPIAQWSDDLLVKPGEIGEIVVQGPVVTREYVNRPAATALAKIMAADAFYHRMGDLGYFDEQGRLWFCGRKSQRVVTREGTLFTIPCEAVFNNHPQVQRTALVGVGQNGSARPVLCVERKPAGTAAPERLTAELLELGAGRPHTRSIRTILFHPGFPVDIRHNAKISREALAQWAARQLA